VVLFYLFFFCVVFNDLRIIVRLLVKFQYEHLLDSRILVLFDYPYIIFFFF